MLSHIHTAGIAPTLIRYCLWAHRTGLRCPLGGGSNQTGDLCMGCLPRLIWVVSLSTAHYLFGRNTSAVLISHPAKARLDLLLVMTAERYLFFCWIVDWTFENQSQWNCYLAIWECEWTAFVELIMTLEGFGRWNSTVVAIGSSG